jgi:hypothetical protein
MVSGDTAREANGTNLLTPCDLEEIHVGASRYVLYRIRLHKELQAYRVEAVLENRKHQKTQRLSHSNRAPRALFSPHHRMSFLCSLPRIYISL